MSDLEVKGLIYETEQEIREISEAIRKNVDRVRSLSMQLSWSQDGFSIFNLGHQLMGLKREVEKGVDLHETLKTLLLHQTELKKKIIS